MKIELFYVAVFDGEELKDLLAGPFVNDDLAHNAQRSCEAYLFGSRYTKVIKTEHESKDWYD